MSILSNQKHNPNRNVNDRYEEIDNNDILWYIWLLVCLISRDRHFSYTENKKYESRGRRF